LVRNPSAGANATISTSFTNEQQVDLVGWDVQYNWGGDVGYNVGKLGPTDVLTRNHEMLE
jgi:hypothetical protein